MDHAETGPFHFLRQTLIDSLREPLPSLTRRRVYGRTVLPGKATAVIGMRRSGKTFFLQQIRRQRLEGRDITQEQLPYINLEDERLIGVRVDHLSSLVEEYYRLFPDFRERRTVTWCFDEIQTVPGWERFVRRLLDTEKVEVFVSGSSAALLSREIATAMRGRAWEVVIFPFSFEEFLRHRGHGIPAQPDRLGKSERSFLEGSLREYLVVGGFPEVQGLETTSRFRVLSDYVDVAVLRDVVERHQVRNVTALRWLVRHLLGNPGAPFSVEKFYRFLRSQGLKVSRDTLHSMLSYLEDCFLIRITSLESASERQKMVNPRKIYPVDAGLIPVYDRTGRANLGHALETVVRVELERRGYHVTYVKVENGYEVDFLARSPVGSHALIQVCADASSEEVFQRETRSLLLARERFPGARCLLVTLTPEAVRHVAPPIQVRSAATWLLQEDLLAA